MWGLSLNKTKQPSEFFSCFYHVLHTVWHQTRHQKNETFRMTGILHTYSVMSHGFNNNNFIYLNHQHCVRMSWHSSWYFIIRAFWYFLLPRLRSSDRDVPPTEKLHSEPWGWLLLRLCGCSWNRSCVSNCMMYQQSFTASNYANSFA